MTDLFRKQRTLAKPTQFDGIGLHTGRRVSMRFCPAKEGHGVAFQRIDLPTKPIIPATLEYVRDVSSRSTNLGVGDVTIHTVEHVLAALRAYQIDNLLIEISDLEPPVADGSSIRFVEMVEEAGIVEQNQMTPIMSLKAPVFLQQDDYYIIAMPYHGFKVSYTLSYPQPNILSAQYHSGVITSDYFKKELASCRTFSRYEEVSTLIDRGLIKGGSLSNSLIIKDNAIFSFEGLRYPDEMVRHKVLDLVGDLSLIGYTVNAHIVAARSGHMANYEFAKLLYKHITMESH